MAEIFVSVTVRIQGIATESGAAEVVADTDAVTADVRKIADEPRA